MVSTTFVDQVTPIVAAWANDVNAATYAGTGGSLGQPFNVGATGSVATTLQAKVKERVSVLDFGAVGDGVTNNYAAFTNAIAYCKSIGAELYIPHGNYVIDTTVGSLILEFINIKGEGVTNCSATPGTAGSVLSITGTANSPFKMKRGVTLDGIAIYYPNQVDSATPVVYPPTISVDITDGPVNFCYVKNCTVFNAYRFFVDTDATGSIGHVIFDKNVIYGILTCFEFANSVEVVKFTDNNFTFGHWLAATEGGCRGYTRANGTIMQWTRSDGFIFTGNLCFGYLNGISFATSASLCQLINIESNLFDQVRNGIVASGTGNLSGTQIVGNSFISYNSQNTALSGHAINISTTGVVAEETLMVSGNNFSTCTQDQIITTGTAVRSLTFSSNSFTAWATYAVSGSYGALNITGASTSYVATGNTFLSQVATYAAGILGACVYAVLSGNLFGGCSAAINASFVSLVTNGNISYGTSGATTDLISANDVYQVDNLWDKPSGKTTRTAFRAYQTASQTTSGTTPLTLAFAATLYNRGTNFTSTTFTAPKAGRYRFEFAIFHDNTGTAGDRFTISLTTVSSGISSLSYKMIADYNSITGATEFQMPALDTLTLVVTRVGGTGVLNTANDGNSNWLCGSLIE
jgi:hypothetical protein